MLRVPWGCGVRVHAPAPSSLPACDGGDEGIGRAVVPPASRGGASRRWRRAQKVEPQQRHLGVCLRRGDGVVGAGRSRRRAASWAASAAPVASLLSSSAALALVPATAAVFVASSEASWAVSFAFDASSPSCSAAWASSLTVSFESSAMILAWSASRDFIFAFAATEAASSNDPRTSVVCDDDDQAA